MYICIYICIMGTQRYRSPAPYRRHPTPYTLHLHPASYSINSTRYTLHHPLHTLHQVAHESFMFPDAGIFVIKFHHTP